MMEIHAMLIPKISANDRSLLKMIRSILNLIVVL